MIDEAWSIQAQLTRTDSAAQRTVQIFQRSLLAQQLTESRVFRRVRCWRSLQFALHDTEYVRGNAPVKRGMALKLR